MTPSKLIAAVRRHRASLRFLSFAFVFIASCLVLGAQARAEAEFCPARVDAMHSFVAPNGGLRSFEVSAESERIVSGNVVVQGEKGWYSFQFVNAVVAPDKAKYKSSTVTFDRTLYHSKLLYVRFPADDRLVRWWVNDAATSGEKVLGWDARGDVQCSPEPGGDTNVPQQRDLAARVDKGADDFNRLPEGTDAVLVPVRIEQPAGMMACAHPFVPASVTTAVTPKYPDTVNGFAVPLTSSIEVAVTAEGKILDAWIYQPTGVMDFDVAAMNAAKNSAYRGGIALCKPAPGVYLFTVTFGAM